MGNGGVLISDSTVYAYTVSEDGYGAIASDKDVSIRNATVDAKTNSIYGDVTIWAGNDLIPSSGDITISDSSKVTIHSATGNAAYTPTGSIIISDSDVTATSSGDSPALVAACDITLSNGIVNASTKGQEYGVWAQQNLLIEGAADVTASGGKGAIGAADSFTLIPPDGKMMDVWMGGSQDDVSRYSGLPLAEETVITEESLYFHSELHTHTFNTQVISDAYKASDATCTEPAKYYFSCVCGEKGTEVFANGDAAGHKPAKTGEKPAACTEEGYTGDIVCKDCGAVLEKGTVIAKIAHDYKDGKCTVCGAADPDCKTDTRSPQTADDSNIALWTGAVLAAGTVLTGAVLYNRRRKYGR